MTVNETLRVEIWRHGLALYEVAGRASVNPRTLSRVLRGLEPLTPEIERRVRAVLDEEAAIGRRIVGEAVAR